VGISTGSRANVVAVVDTGIDYNHQDLSANVWSAPTSFTIMIGSNNITCLAGSHGFNALNNTCDPLDDNNHGSHTSGTIGAVGNNGVGVAGVNWTASIMGVKFLNAAGSGSTAGAINSIEFTIQAKQIFGPDANVRVLSNNWGGGGFSQALLDEINRANANNMLFVAAAGNNGSNNDISAFYPASYNAPNVVAVARRTTETNLLRFQTSALPRWIWEHRGSTCFRPLSETTTPFSAGHRWRRRMFREPRRWYCPFARSILLS
jgi:subtilisin family serine protease